MKLGAQKGIALGAALAAALMFIGANAHLLIVAIQSQPECREAVGALPAKRSC